MAGAGHGVERDRPMGEETGEAEAGGAEQPAGQAQRAMPLLPCGTFPATSDDRPGT